MSYAITCVVLPSGDAPERVVFGALRRRSDPWGNVWTRLGRDLASTADACERAMLLGDHHDWVNYAANQLRVGGIALWQALCAEYASTVSDTETIPTRNAIEGVIL